MRCCCCASCCAVLRLGTSSRLRKEAESQDQRTDQKCHGAACDGYVFSASPYPPSIYDWLLNAVHRRRRGRRPRRRENRRRHC